MYFILLLPESIENKNDLKKTKEIPDYLWDAVDNYDGSMEDYVLWLGLTCNYP